MPIDPFGLLGSAIANVVTDSPVSYTHLDVYKRQEQYSTSDPATGG